MKAVLCSVPTGNETTFTGHSAPHMGLITLATYMERNGYGPDSYDLFDINMVWPTDEEIRAYFQEAKPIIAGLSAVLSTTYFHVKRISRIIRETCPDCLIVMGGPLSASAAVVLRKTDVDICVSGDGEIAWLKLVRYAEEFGRKIVPERLSRIRGTIYVNEDEVAFNGFGDQVIEADLPLPNYDMVKRGIRWKPERISNFLQNGRDIILYNLHSRTQDPGQKPKCSKLFTSKGCVARCTFCQRNTRGYRLVSLEKLDAHLKDLRDNYDVGFININDENFASNRKYAYEVARLMKKHGMIWAAAGVRASSVTFEDMQFYKEHDCASMFFAIESGSPAILDVMEKKFPREKTFEAVEYCAKLDILTNQHVLLGMPGESEETVRESGDFLGRMSHMMGIHPYEMWPNALFALPVPGTPLYEYAQQIGAVGSSIDEEDQYLLQLNERLNIKGCYININGAPPSEVWFWEPLLRIEASRAYAKLARQTPPKFSRLGQLVKEGREEGLRQMKKNRTFRLKIYDFIVESILLSKNVDRIPGFILYPTVKYLIYTEFLLKNFVKTLLGHPPAYNYKPGPNVKRVTKESYKSLRKLVEEGRGEVSNQEALVVRALSDGVLYNWQ